IDGDATAAERLRERLPAELPVLLAPRDHNPMLGAYLIDAYPTYTVIEDGVAVESFGALPEVQKWLAGATKQAARR
ncbi:MAG TPA: hypothetical protein VD813_04915, partial [Pseudonocardia sp.]|nr:hypothetical protein [Pseudonocardia sp.]